MELNFKIQNDRLVAGSVLEGNSGNVGTYICNFEILDNADFLWLCVFKKGDVAYQQVIEDGSCIIPKEVLEEPDNIEIGCYGTSSDMRISTNWLTFSVKDGAYSVATAPQVPTPDVWEELMQKTLPYVGESGNWYVYNIETETYVDSGMPSRGEKGDTGLSETTRFSVTPQIDITTEELVRYIDVDEIDGVPFADYNFTYAKVLFTNNPQTEQLSTEFQAKLNNSSVYVSAPTGFLYYASKQYWSAHFDLKNCLAIGHKSSMAKKSWRGDIVMTTDPGTFASLETITSFRFYSALQNIPVGTNIKVWLK